ncbi:MAG: DEAD/DEAH box helicase family protein [Lentisphaerae bacterium]|nr:DEAD/DEAH box helicase family protein [Lentisphaerota bacterium]
MPESEWQTRKKRIDAKLRALTQPWDIVPYRADLDTSSLHAVAVEEYPTASGPADYALFVHGQLLAFIEAKTVAVSPQNVLEQAKRYSKTATDGPGIWKEFRVPFLYATNGEQCFFIDIRPENSYSRQVSSVHTADALAEAFTRDPDFAWFGETPLTIPRLRYYQEKAIQKTEQAVAEGNRNMLVAMATGTGKTYTTVSQIYRMLESKQFRRILFLVDRRALAVQAVREFSSFATPKGNKFNQEYEVYHQKFRREDYDQDTPFDPKILPETYLTKPDPSKTFVYVSTIQRMAINLYGLNRTSGFTGDQPKGEAKEYDEDAGKLDIPNHAFDVIIADECHRGYTASETGIWRDALNHFDAVKIGLTATPAAHTLALFKKVVYRYTTDKGILDGYLVDYEPIKIDSKVRMKGVFLKEGEEVGVIDTETGNETLDQMEDEREFATAEVERKITSPDSNKKIIAEIAKYAAAHEEQVGHFPKMLIFADNDLQHTSHADQIVRICREQFNRGDDFVQKITGSPNVDRPLQRIREFRNRPKPCVVVTVDMLSTGVDIPAIEFVVFMRPVKSRIMWEQMLGRGTRLCPAINKEKFVVFDCLCGTLFEYFKGVTSFADMVPRKEPIPIEKVIDNIYQNVDRDYYVKILVKRLRRIERAMSAEAREQFAPFIPDGNMGGFADELPYRIKKDFAGTMKILRNDTFQNLLVNYPRAKRSFYIGYETEDEVSSQAMIHAGADYQKPEDYLDSFVHFVKENPAHIEAITVLLERPKEWRTDLLEDLRKKLAQNSYDEELLRKAHKLVHHKALADIISMIKHAAGQEPLFDVGERVERAVQRVCEGSAFTDEQQKWIDYIGQHLAANLSIELDDFDTFPVFEQRGGLRKVRRLFERELETLIAEFNAAIAA